MMDADLIAAFRAGWPIVHLVTVNLPGHTIRWADAGFVRWGSEVWRARDPIYGVLDEIGDIPDGIDDDASPVQIVVSPPDLTSLAALASADAQGGWVTVHVGSTNPDTGELAGEPYQLHVGELDQPRLVTGKTRKLEYDIITGEARGLQPNEEQRQTDAFRKFVWPGERGDEYATDGPKWVYWRDDEPRNAIGLLTGRGGSENRAIEFTYEPKAPLCFPLGRCAVSGDVRYRVGYGPTNRFQTVFATVGASGPVQGLVSVQFDDEITTFDGDDRATNGEHSGFMWFNFVRGEQPSAALTSPVGPEAHPTPAPGWTIDHRLSGRPAFAWTGKENSKKSEFNGGIPKPLLTLDGLLGWDPRLDSTWPGGSGSCRLDDPVTWVGLDEGAIWALNWCIGRWEGSDGGSPAKYGVPYASTLVGGIGAQLNLIDVEAFVAAADVADANGWKLTAVCFSDEDKYDVLGDMLAASGAVRCRRGGRISCVSMAAATTTVLTATARDTAAPVTIALAPSRLDRINTGVPSFMSADNRWEMTPVSAVSDDAWIAADGGRRTDGFDFRMVPSADQAAQLCYLAMAHEREEVGASATFKPWMLQLEPGKAFAWDAPEYLLEGAKVRVRKRTWSPRGCTAKIDFRQETDPKYAAALAVTGTPPPVSVPDTPPPPFVEQPTDFTVTPDAPDMLIAYRNPDPVLANHDFVNILRADDSLDAADAVVIDFYAGAPGDFIVRPDVVAGPNLYGYWLQAVDVTGNLAALLGPVQANATLEADTNLLAAPNDFADAAWEKGQNGTGVTPNVTADFGVAPDGTATADRIQFVTAGTDGDSSDHSYVRQVPSGADGAQYGAIWLKSNTGSAQTVYLRCSGEQVAVTVEPYWRRFVETGTGSRSLWLGLRGSVTGTAAAADILAWQGHLAMS